MLSEDDIYSTSNDKEKSGMLKEAQIEPIDQNSLCIRFIKKKFKCIVIFILLLIAIFELCNTILSKIDGILLNSLIENISARFKTPIILTERKHENT